MKIINETELMANQKASTTVLPDLEFEALQTSAGHSLLFSISSENIFYCTCEVPGDTHGWQRVNLSAAISSRDFGGQPIKVKSFDLGQDLNAGTIDLVLAVNAGGQDWLYVSLGNADSNWGGYSPTWQQVKFDDPDNLAYGKDPINDVFIARFGSNQFIFADIVSNPENQALSRYAIDPTGQVMLNTAGVAQCWIPHTTQMTLQAGHISSAVGCGPGDESVNGIYTLYSIDGNPQLVYAPLFNEYDPGGAPFPTDFQLPGGTNDSYMAMAISKPSASAPNTDLFFATNGSLYFSKNAAQINVNGVNPSFNEIFTNDLFNNIQNLTVNNWNGNIVLWGQSLDPADMQTSRLFVMECAAGQETNASAWSAPIPLLFNVKNSATYIHDKYSAVNTINAASGNAYGSCTVMFAHQSDGSLVQLFQDPITSAWQQRYLLTEPLDATTVLYETTSYTTHIRITDDNNMASPFIPVSIWASSPCSLFVNETYSNLAFTSPLQTTADETGTINIMQPVDTIGGIAYFVAVQDPTSKQWFTQVVNPLAVTAANITAQVPNGNNNYLGGSVKDENNNSTPLIDSSKFDANAQKSTSQTINSFGQHYSQLNADGLATGQSWPTPGVTAVQEVQVATRPLATPDRLGKNLRFNEATDKIWGVTFGKNAQFFEGIDAMKGMGVTLNADGSLSIALENGELGSVGSWIEAKAGHLYKWMQSEANKLEKLVVQIGEDGLDCLMTIAGTIYHFVAKCMNDIVNAIHTALNAIETAFEDLVKWIGSIFAWHDFVATHSVIRNLFITYGNYSIQNIDTLISGLDGFVDNVMGAIDNWAGLPDDSGQSQSKNNNQDVGQHKPQSNWGQHHMKNNATNSVYSLAGSEYSAVMNGLITVVTNEGEILAGTLSKLESIDITTISMADLVKQLVAIIADDVLQSIQNILTTFLQVIEELVQGMMDTMAKETITIPVLSQLYERYVGSPLTILDLTCLVVSIPVTVIYKLANNGTTPFPAGDPDTLALAGAADYLSLSQLCVDQSDVQASAVAGVGDSGWVPPKLNNRWGRLFFSGNVMAFFGGLGIAAFGYLKTKNSSSKMLATCYTLSYFPYVGPDIVGNVPAMVVKDTRWFSILNCAFAGAGIVKAIADTAIVFSPQPADAPAPPSWLKTGKSGWDFFSPIIDAVLNGAWELPVVEAFVNSEKIANDIVDLVANTAFNASGVIAPLVTFEVPPGQPFWLVIQTGLNVVYGVGSMLESLDGQPIDPITLK